MPRSEVVAASVRRTECSKRERMEFVRKVIHKMTSEFQLVSSSQGRVSAVPIAVVPSRP